MEDTDIKILKSLRNHPSGLSAKSMAETCGVSINTIRRKIASLSGSLRKHGFTIDAKPGSGYTLVIENEEVSDAFFRDLIHFSNSPLFENNTSSDYKCNYMIRRLLCADHPFSLQKMADELMYSESSLRKDLKAVSETLEQYGLKMTMKRGVGLSVSGNELARRLCLNAQHKLYVNLDAVQQNAEPWFRNAFGMDDPVMRFVEKRVRKAISEEENLSFMAIDLPAAIYYLPMIRYRHDEMENGFEISPAQEKILGESGMKEYAGRLLETCQEELKPDEAEINAYAQLLLALRSVVSLKQLRKEEQQEMMALAEECIHYVSSFLNVFQHADQSFFEKTACVLYSIRSQLVFHIYPDEEHYRIYKNIPLLVEDMCLYAEDFIEKKLQHPIDGRLVLPLSFLFNEQLKKEFVTLHKKKVLVVSTYGIQYADYVKSRILKQYGSEFSEGYAVEFTEKKPEDCDLLVTDLRADMLPEKYRDRSVHMDLMNEEVPSFVNLEAVLDEMHTAEAEKYMYFLDLDAENMKDALRQVGVCFEDVDQKSLFRRMHMENGQSHEYTLLLSASSVTTATGLYFFHLKNQLEMNERKISQIVVCAYQPDDLHGMHVLYQIMNTIRINL